MAFSSSLNMINITVIAVFFSLSILTAECRPQNFDLVKSIAGNKNDDWKNDKDYTFKWEGAFSLGVPEETRCPMVLQPEHGRFVCSFGTLSERSMCLVECKIGFEQDRPPVVYICENSKWFDLTRKPISTPELQCIPKPVSSHEFAE